MRKIATIYFIVTSLLCTAHILNAAVAPTTLASVRDGVQSDSDSSDSDLVILTKLPPGVSLERFATPVPMVPPSFLRRTPIQLVKPTRSIGTQTSVTGELGRPVVRVIQDVDVAAYVGRGYRRRVATPMPLNYDTISSVSAEPAASKDAGDEVVAMVMPTDNPDTAVSDDQPSVGAMILDLALLWALFYPGK